jgi:hypothetical protein
MKMTTDEKRENWDERVRLSCQAKVLRRHCVDALTPRAALALVALVGEAEEFQEGGDSSGAYPIFNLGEKAEGWGFQGQDVAEELAACGFIDSGSDLCSVTEDGVYAVHHLQGRAA